MGKKRGDLLSDLSQAKQALIASERRGRKAVRRLRDIEKVFEVLLPKMKSWTALPVSDEAPARCLTTGDVRKLLLLLESPPSQEEVVDQPEDV